MTSEKLHHFEMVYCAARSSNTIFKPSWNLNCVVQEGVLVELFKGHRSFF